MTDSHRWVVEVHGDPALVAVHHHESGGFAFDVRWQKPSGIVAAAGNAVDRADHVVAGRQHVDVRLGRPRVGAGRVLAERDAQEALVGVHGMRVGRHLDGVERLEQVTAPTGVHDDPNTEMAVVVVVCTASPCEGLSALTALPLSAR